MKPVHLYIENFMNHLVSDIDCSLFDSVLVVGKNRNNDRESNGLGKSTIFNAIEYALFNAPPPNLNLDNLIHDDESIKKCKVIFTFETDRGTFKITRSRGKKSDVELEELSGKEWKSRSGKTSSATDKIIKSIIGLNHKTFKYSVLFAQGDEFGLASATPEARRAMLKEPLNLSMYSKYEKLVKELAKLKQQEIDKYKAIIESLGDPDTDIEATKLGLKSSNNTITQLNSEMDSIRTSIEQKRSLLSSLENTISSGDNSVIEKLNNIRQNINSAQSNVNSLKAFMQDASLKKSAAESELTQCKRDLKILTEVVETLANNNFRTEEDINEDLEKIKKSELKGIRYIAKLEAQQSELKEFLLPDSEDCPYCKQSITEEHRADCSTQIETDLKKINDNLNIYRPKLDKVVEKKWSFEKELKEASDRDVKLARSKGQVESKKDDINSKENIIQQLDSMLSEHDIRYNKAETELNELKEQEGELETLSEKAFKQQSIAKKILVIKSEIDDLENDQKKHINSIQQYSAMKGSLDEKLKSRLEDKKKLDNEKKKVSKIEKELKNHKRVIQAFGSTGIPSMVISTILDDLQVEANDLLSQIKPEIELQFYIEKEKNDGQQAETLEIGYRVHGKKRSYYQLSGAQKLVVALSLKLGLSQVIQHRLGVDIKFLALDEVDQSLDKAGVDALVDVIKKWQNKFKIFVITHNDSLKDKFSHAIVVEGDIENGVNASVASSW